MTIVKEFRQFIARGNVIDMAVGIIVGAAFTGIVNSLVNDIIMPVIGVLTSGIDFSNLFFTLSGKTYPTLKATKDAGASVISYGLFINAIINFLIVSFVVFMMVQQVNRIKKHEDAAVPPLPPAPPADIILLTEIRDLLKTK